MRMMNCFCGMVDRRKVLSFISSLNHCQRFSPSEISDTLRAIFDFAQLPYLSTEIIFQLYWADLALKIHSWNSGFYTKKRVSIFWIFDQNFSWSYLVFNVFKATGHWRRSGVFIVDFERISHFALVFLLLTWSR